MHEEANERAMGKRKGCHMMVRHRPGRPLRDWTGKKEKRGERAVKVLEDSPALMKQVYCCG